VWWTQSTLNRRLLDREPAVRVSPPSFVVASPRLRVADCARLPPRDDLILYISRPSLNLLIARWNPLLYDRSAHLCAIRSADVALPRIFCFIWLSPCSNGGLSGSLRGCLAGLLRLGMFDLLWGISYVCLCPVPCDSKQPAKKRSQKLNFYGLAYDFSNSYVIGC
jgi:hypothetical protein